MNPWKLIFHVHTRHSFDSHASVPDVVEMAVRLGAQALIVTDHGTMQGAREASEYAARHHPALVVPLALEAVTNAGDLIGVFLQDEPPQTDPLQFCDAVHAQGGLVVLPHPYRCHRLEGSWLERVDLVEVFNARSTSQCNSRAEALAAELGLPGLASPDAHRPGEMHLANTEFWGTGPDCEANLRQALLAGDRRHSTQYGSPWDEWRSQAIKWRKSPSRALAGQLLQGAVTRLLLPGRFRRA